MRTIRLCAALSLGLLASQRSIGAEPTGIAIERGAERLATLTDSDLSKLPAIHISVAFGTEHGPRLSEFEGPLLWTVLIQAHALDFAKPGDQARQIISLTGRDGYTAVLGLGEISPDFEGKQVILAEQMNGQPLGPEHLRIVVPGDKKGGRSVRDIVAIAVMPLQSMAK